MNKIIIVGGLTATGKTNLALQIAKKFNGELINADSRQIYKYLNIGTNKEYSQEIPIHLLDIVTPEQRFNVYEYQQAAFKTIQEIIARGKLPILVGGTGLYIDAVIKNYNLNQSENLVDRSELEILKKSELQKKLFLLNPGIYDQLNNSDKNNPRRLVRLIEKTIAEQSENVLLTDKNPPKLQFQTLFLYPEYNWEELKIKIENRVEQMFKDGLVAETKKLLEMGYKNDDPGMQIMGYRQVIQFLAGEFDAKKCIELIKFAHKQYAKRQRTWFEGAGRNYKLVKVNTQNFNSEVVASFLEQLRQNSN